MNIMNKRGLQDNIVTYEHYCDTKTDLSNIPKNQITLGSVAIVLQDEDGSMGIYIANSNKEWISFSNGGSGNGDENSMSNISLANLIDVSLANPADGDILVYDGTSEKWVAQTNGGSGNNDSSSVMIVHPTQIQETPERYNTDYKFTEIYNHIMNDGSVFVFLNDTHTHAYMTLNTCTRDRIIFSAYQASFSGNNSLTITLWDFTIYKESYDADYDETIPEYAILKSFSWMVT